MCCSLAPLLPYSHQWILHSKFYNYHTLMDYRSYNSLENQYIPLDKNYFALLSTNVAVQHTLNMKGHPIQ